MTAASTTPIEADPTLGGESDVDDVASVPDTTASITSSIFENHYFQGRTYSNPKYGRHWAPNDEEQLEALDIIHHWVTLMLNDKLYLPPIGDNPQKILDIGTGTGIWAINVADAFPSATVIGTDISPSQPSWVPPNLEFQIDDAQLDWTYEPESFDFINIRFMQGTIDNWEKVYSQVYKFLKPGGWFQHLEPDLQMRSENPSVKVDENHIYTQWAKIFEQVGDKMGRTLDFSNRKLEELAQGAGFTSITFQSHKMPVGHWPKDKKMKELGTFVSLGFSQALDGFVKVPLCQVLGWSTEEMLVFAANMRKMITNRRNRTTGGMFGVYGQKPLTAG